MKYRYTLSTLALLLLQSTGVIAFSGGPDDGYAGDPPNQRTCVACHNSFQLNSGQGSLRLAGLPQSYSLGETYRLEIQLADPNARRWGFELTAKIGNNNRGGALAVIDNNRTQLSNPGGNSGQYLKHRSAGTFQGQANSAAWGFDWTAPNEDLGQITFYYAGNAANNNGGTGGDRIYSSSAAISAFQNHSPVIQEPVGEDNYAVEIESETEFSLEFNGTDEDQDELVWSFSNRGGLPEQAVLTDHGDGSATFSWTPSEENQGEFTPVLRLEDSHDGFDQIELAITVTGGRQAEFIVRLAAAWNLVSAPVSPAETNIPALWQELVDRNHLIMIKDQSGRFYRVANRFSNLSPWDFRQGYFVRMNTADTMVIAGGAVAVDTPIPLREGWNFAAYFPTQNIAAPMAFANITDDLIIAKDVGGRFYMPGRGFNNMAPLSRGNGYQVRTAREVQLVWNIPQRQEIESRERSGEIQSAPKYFSDPVRTASNMSLLVTSQDPFEDWTDLGVFTVNGLCVGAASIIGDGPWGIAVWGDDPSTPQVDGAVEGEILSIRFEESISRKLVNSPTLSYIPDNIEEFDLTFAPVSEFELITLYPNPFNSSLTIEYNLEVKGTVKFRITDVSGRTIVDLVSAVHEAGKNHVRWDATGLESGVYFVEIESAGRTSVRKALYVR